MINPQSPYHFLRRLLVAALLIGLCPAARAQATDTLTLIRQLIQAGTAYRQLPLYIEMEMKNTTNFMTGEDDTASTTGSFYLLSHAAYVRMGEAEQLITDSMALVVSNKLERMMLYKDGQAALSQMKMPGGLSWQDSSATQIAARYTLQRLSVDNSKEVYHITDKRLLYGTTLPRESMELQFEAGTHQPLAMIALKRTLVPLPAEDYSSLRQNTSLAGNLLNLGDKEYYLIREQKNSFIYKAISHDTGRKIPITMSDRVRPDSQGIYQPVEAYKHFVLSIHE
ncbi:hypothetical protein [Paraflavitalea speifideaquila]|uniref:hypothetical protein n=1 Tax=Paraflavitalea speifideaquila TaxID=3076558 RepID=UPI0028E57E81|nr:hypothetical protein [Paraflavitalea speifideiaquila]